MPGARKNSADFVICAPRPAGKATRALFACALALTLSLPAHAARRSCSELYALAAEQLAEVKKDFLARHSDRYTIEVETTAIRNQCQYGSCWIYGTLADVESALLREKGVTVDLSEQYLILKSLEERIKLALANPGRQLEEGGFGDVADRLLETYGTVPSEVWQPRVPFESDPHKGRLMSFLQNRIGQYHVAVAEQPGEKARLLAEAEDDLRGILEAYAGNPPEAFTYRDVRYAGPADFGKRFLPKRDEPVLMFPAREDVAESLRKVKPTSASNKPAGARGKKSELVVPMARLERSIVDTLKKGQTVPFAVEMAREFIDKSTGIMSPGAFHTPPGFAPAPYYYRQHFRISGGGHQMTIVGADLDESGKVIKFKVKNSWGEKSGDAGFYHMYEDYFRTYVTGAYIR